MYQLTEFRLKPMFKDDLHLSWRKLHGMLKEFDHIGKAELYEAEPSKLIALVEWKSDPSVVDKAPFDQPFKEMLELVDRVQIMSPLKPLERTQ